MNTPQRVDVETALAEVIRLADVSDKLSGDYHEGNRAEADLEWAAVNFVREHAKHIASLLQQLADYQRERAELYDRLNGTPCAEIRWLQEREQLMGELLSLRNARDAGADLDNDDMRDDAGFWFNVAAFRGIELTRQVERAEAAERAREEAEQDRWRTDWPSRAQGESSMTTTQRVDVARLSELLAVMASSDPNRMTEFPGGCDCYECGNIFIGGAGHDYCAQCEAKRQLLAMLPEALPSLLQQLAEAERAREEAQSEAATERALQRAAKELPEGWLVRVEVERGSGWVELSEPDGTNHTHGLIDADDTLAESIGRAIEAAFLAANGGASED